MVIAHDEPAARAVGQGAIAVEGEVPVVEGRGVVVQVVDDGVSGVGAGGEGEEVAGLAEEHF